jgi:hypothetical protein
MPVFSKRHGYEPTKKITFREKLPMELRTPILEILGGCVSDAVESKRFLLSCPWFQVYDVIEEIIRQLDFYETELRSDPEEELRAGPLQSNLNDYFVYAGIGWQLVDGKVSARGDEAFESTLKTTVTVLEAQSQPRRDICGSPKPPELTAQGPCSSRAKTVFKIRRVCES